MSGAAMSAVTARKASARAGVAVAAESRSLDQAWVAAVLELLLAFFWSVYPHHLLELEDSFLF